LYVRILTLVHQDAADELNNFLRSLSSESSSNDNEADNQITPSTWFIKRAKRNLLHLCAYLQAPSCVRLLLQPPYAWDPDQPDRTNRTPLHLAEARDDLITQCELILCTREQRQPARWPVTRLELDGLASICLFWPQQLLALPIPLSAVS
uniref:ANK_REP_REGION domain-containing protein n=1 Tax=Echinostoma caproni TaxID=27848 RepID=A0A183A0U2_9TREM